MARHLHYLPGRASSSNDMKPLVVIAVEQEEIQKDLAEQLRSIAEIRTIGCVSPIAAAKTLSEAPPDVLVLGSGELASVDLVDLIRCLRPTARIILYAPCGSDEDVSIVERGIYFYAAGVSVAELADVVRSALRSPNTR